MAVNGGFGILYKIKVAGTLTTIPGVEDGSLPKRELITKDTTAHDSAGGYQERGIPGLKTLSEFNFTVFWDSASTVHQAVLTALKSLSPVDMQIVKPGSTETITLTAFVKSMKPSTDQEDMTKCEFGCVPTGQPTVA